MSPNSSLDPGNLTSLALFYIICRLFFRSTSARTYSWGEGGVGGGISTCSYLVHVRMLSSLSLVKIGGKTQDASFPCLFWLLVYFLFRFVSVYKYVSLFVFFLNSSFSSWLVSAYSPSMCIRSLSCHTSLVEERCVTCKEWLRPCPA